MQKLQRKKLKLVGRQAQMKILREAFADCCAAGARAAQPQEHFKQDVDTNSKSDTGRSRHLVCIAGPSGSGKSRLAKEAFEWTAQKQHGAFYVTGKFDTLQREEPFAGLQPAMLSLCHQIMARERSRKTDNNQVATTSLACMLLKGLGHEDICLLKTMIPLLADVLEGASLPSTFSSPNNVNGNKSNHYKEVIDHGVSLKQNADRLKFVLRRFVEIVSSFAPILWICDDVQWSDVASLDLILSLLTDPNISSLMMVCCYRDEVPQHVRPFENIVEQVQELQDSRSIALTKLTVQSVTADHVTQMIAEALATEPGDKATQALATLVHKRTGGNPFYVTQFLPTLVHDKLLVYDTSQCVWTWDIDKVRTHSRATENVVDLVEQELQRVHVKEHLLLAACMGTTFNDGILSTVLDGFCSNHVGVYENAFGFPPEPFDFLVLAEWVEFGVIEGFNGEDYAFVHDKIQEAALTLVPPVELAKIRFTIGSILFQKLSSEELEKNIFMVADLLQACPDLLPTEVNERLRIVALHDKAGSKAKARSAFVSAMSFYKSATSMLPDNHWERYHDLSLDLYSSAVECAFAVGDLPAMRHYAKEVMESDLPMLQKMRVAVVLMDAEVAESVAQSDSATDRQDATKLGLKVLSELGCRFPRSNFMLQLRTLSSLMRMKGSTKKTAPDAIENLPKATDPVDIAILMVLVKMVTASYLTNPNLMPLCIAMGVQRTFVKGYTEYSPVAFAWAGLLVGYFMGDPAAGAAFGQASLALMEKLNGARTSMARNTLISHAFALHVLLPLRKCLDPLLEAYKIGLSTGDVDSGAWGVFFFMEFNWLDGASLETLCRDAATYSTIMKDFGQMQPLLTTSYLWQLWENLSIGPETTNLIGDAFDENVGVPEMRRRGNIVQLAKYSLFKLAACCFFGDLAKGADLAVEHGDQILQYLPGQPVLLHFYYWAGMCCYAMVNTSKTPSKLKRCANRCRKKLKECGRKGNPNCFHLESLLDAEYEKSRGNLFVCVKLYESGILLSGRQGIPQYQNLGNERFARYWKDRGDDDEATYRFSEALHHYKVWGAQHKAGLLRASIGDAFVTPKEVTVKVS